MMPQNRCAGIARRESPLNHTGNRWAAQSQVGEQSEPPGPPPPPPPPTTPPPPPPFSAPILNGASFPL